MIDQTRLLYIFDFTCPCKMEVVVFDFDLERCLRGNYK